MTDLPPPAPPTPSAGNTSEVAVDFKMEAVARVELVFSRGPEQTLETPVALSPMGMLDTWSQERSHAISQAHGCSVGVHTLKQH